MNRGSYRGYSSVDKEALIVECMNRPLREVARECKILAGMEEKMGRWWGALPKAKKRAKGAGAKPTIPCAKEEELVDWIKDGRTQGLAITTHLVRTRAREIWPVEEFKATHGWYQRFQKRWNLTTRSPTKQRKSKTTTIEELNKSIESFWHTIIDLRTRYTIEPKRIVDLRGVSRPVVFTTGSEKKRCTVVLACRADGQLLPPMVIFKGKKQNHKSIRTIVRSRGTVVMVQPKAWMD